MEKWNLKSKVRAITSDNGSDIVAGISHLYQRVFTSGSHRSIRDFHVRCIAHVVNLAVRECLSQVHSEIQAIRALLNSIRSSTKRRDLFERVRDEMGEVHTHCPGLDVVTRWSSTFNMIQDAYNARNVLNSVSSRLPELSSHVISEEEWERAKRICDFLKTAASITENQSGQNYVTISISSMAYKLLMQKCQSRIDSNDQATKPIASTMLRKLKSYESIICSDMAILAKVVDPRIPNDVLRDSDILYKWVDLPDNGELEVIHSTEQGSGTKSLFDLVLENEQTPLRADSNEISMFLRATALGDYNADPLQWWKANQNRFPNIARVARDVLAIQPSSVASESVFSCSGNIVTAQRTLLSDSSIISCILLQSWNKFLS